MICPACKESGRKSIVRSQGQTRTMLNCPPYTDGEGVEHRHDDNTVRETYECSEGHRFVRVSQGSCACGWRGMEPRVDMLEPPA